MVAFFIFATFLDMNGIKIMKHLQLHDLHERLGAKMVDYAGYKMPIHYSGVNEEHLAVRNNVGIFDVSHMGEFLVSGPNAMQLLQRTTTNDIRRLTPGSAQYTCFPNGKGGIVDDLIVYQLEGSKYMLVVNAANIQKDFTELKVILTKISKKLR